MTPSPARTAPAAARNAAPILDVLRRVLPATGLVLEIASGSGEHALWFSTALPHLRWQPTDHDPDALPSIAAWREQGGTNLLPPFQLDAASPDWPLARADVVLSVNMIHIAPWSATEGLVAGAARLLPAEGLLILYGPFLEDGTPTAPGNTAFDADLRARDPAWGLRRVAAVTDLAATHALHLQERVPMPANNLLLVFRRA